MKKKGSHVGIMISFIIFITFLIFLYTILSPVLNMQKEEQSLLDYTAEKIKEKTSADLIVVTVFNDSNPVVYNCLQVNNLELELNGLNSIAKNETLGIVNSSSFNNYLKINWNNPSSNTLFKVYYSNEIFSSFPLIDNSCASSTIASVRTYNYVFKGKIEDLIDDYENDYETLKSELKIPVNNEFGFGFILSDGTFIKTEEKETSLNEYIKEFPVLYFDSEANINLGFISVKILG